MRRPLGIATLAVSLGAVGALVLSHVTYALGWHDDAQLAALYGLGVFVGATASYCLATLES